MTVGSGLPTAAAHPQWSRAPKGRSQANLFISESHLGGNHFQVGDDVTFIIVVGNNSRTRLTTSITVSDAISAGMYNLQARGHDWNIAMDHTKSPTVITATYHGKASINGGEILPAITISGVLTKGAIPSLTSIARVHTGCDCKISNNKATDMIFVKKCSYSQKCSAYDYAQIHKGEKNNGKSKNLSPENTSTTNAANNTPASTNAANNTHASANSAANTASAVAITSVTINNIYGVNSMGTLSALSSGGTSGFNANTGNTSGPSSVGDVSGPSNTEPGSSNTIPGLPNTGSDPRGTLIAGIEA